MRAVKVKDKDYELEDKDAALIEAIQELTIQIGRLVNGG